MADVEHYTDISDIIEDTETEHYLDSEQQNTEPDTGEVIQTVSEMPESELLIPEEHSPMEKKPQNANSKNEEKRLTRLPLGRIKNIMKMDPDVSVVSGDAVFLVTKATELFLETIAKETYSYTSSNKRKTISKKDLDLIINKIDCLCFLEGAMDF